MDEADLLRDCGESDESEEAACGVVVSVATRRLILRQLQALERFR